MCQAIFWNKTVFFLGIIALASFFGCSQKETKAELIEEEDATELPIIKQDGAIISLPKSIAKNYNFETSLPKELIVKEDFVTEGLVVAAIVDKIGEKEFNTVLFYDQNLNDNFSNYLKQLSNFKQLKTNLRRFKDLYENAAATEKDYEEAKLAIQTEEAGIIENEAIFLTAGLDPEDFMNHTEGTVWLIFDLEEEDLDKIKIGTKCTVLFKSIKNKTFEGMIENAGDVLDQVKKTIKLRVEIRNPKGIVKAGMIAKAYFGKINRTYSYLPALAISKVLNKYYVFVQNAPYLIERREVEISKINDTTYHIIKGIDLTDQVIVSNLTTIHELSFGY